LVIPCFNEEQNLEKLISEVRQVADLGKFEFVLVDNGSSDRTAQILHAKLMNITGVRWICLKQNQGYGGGIIAGLGQCTTPLVGWMHADLQTKPTDLLSLPSAWLNETDVFIKGRRGQRPLIDRLFTVGMSVLESALFRTRLWDINAQPTIFPRGWMQSWVDPPQDFSLDLFVYLQAQRCGTQVRRFAVPFGPRFSGSSSWNTGMRSRIRFVRRTLSYSARLVRENAQNSSQSK
jgi:glycosyltransferase involved in cell wall biosynthesis